MAVDTVKRNRRNQAWVNQNRDRINLIFAKGIKQMVQEAADEAGVSKSMWIEAAIREKLNRQG